MRCAIRSALLGIAALVSVACVGTMGQPGLAVELDSQGSFRFTNCKSSQYEVSPSSVTVEDLGTGAVVCRVARHGPEGEMGASWRYGTVPPGFQQSGACLPLQEGHEYRLSLSGSGVGGRTFRIVGGRPVLGDALCKPSP